MLGVLACDEEEGRHRGQAVTLWRYRLADGIDPDVSIPIQFQKCHYTPFQLQKERG